MLPYQSEVVERFVKMLHRRASNILEIGSDIGGEVAATIAEKTGAMVIGVNPLEEFPSPLVPLRSNVKLIRADGRNLPFPDNSFDAVLSVATMEHVNGLDIFLNEVNRVLRHKGLFYSEFSPIWSSAKGHHVYAVAGSKEARFWKPGKNPIPDYAHLTMTPDELRAYLHSGPCSEELIEPIIQWIYFGDSINRCHFEEYIHSFRKCPLIIQSLRFRYDYPDDEILARLHLKYGPEKRNFHCSSISGVFRKPPEAVAKDLIFRGYIRALKILGQCAAGEIIIKTKYIIKVLFFQRCRF